MRAAADCGLDVAKVWLVHDAGNESGLLVERFDRTWDKSARKRVGIHQEDACQLLDVYPANKYRLKTADIARALDVCAAPVLARRKLIELFAYSYLIANGDLHGKNVSVIDSSVGLQLSPAYDLLSTLPSGGRRMALQLDGRDDDQTM